MLPWLLGIWTQGALVRYLLFLTLPVLLISCNDPNWCRGDVGPEEVMVSGSRPNYIEPIKRCRPVDVTEEQTLVNRQCNPQNVCPTKKVDRDYRARYHS